MLWLETVDSGIVVGEGPSQIAPVECEDLLIYEYAAVHSELSNTTPDLLPLTLRGLAAIIDGGLCHRCGTCVGVCPTDVLAFDEESYPRVKAVSACTDCSLCVRVCPGNEFDFHDHNLKKFGVRGEIEDTHGMFIESFLGYANDPWLREHGTSGGVITGLLLHMLETGQIDGALVVVSDEKVLWRGKAVMARTREEVLASVKSKYAVVPVNELLDEVRRTKGRYALVGLPCQIHGFLKAASFGTRLKERVVLTIGLYCHAAVEHEACRIIWDSLGEKGRGAKHFVSRVGKHPGTPHIELSDGTMYPVYFGWRKAGYRPSSTEVLNAQYALYTPSRCFMCFDATSEFADISVGDPWMAPPDADISFHDGWSFALVRTQKGKEVCDGAVQAGDISRRDVTREEALVCNSRMSKEKRLRAFHVIETRKRQGKPVPVYGPPEMKLPRATAIEHLKTRLKMILHLPCSRPRLRAPLLKFFLSDWGYWLFWVNHKRRRFLGRV